MLNELCARYVNAVKKFFFVRHRFCLLVVKWTYLKYFLRLFRVLALVFLLQLQISANKRHIRKLQELADKSEFCKCSDFST